MDIYFSGVIRKNPEDRGWYEKIIRSLGRYGEVLTDDTQQAISAPLGEKQECVEVYERDMAWLKMSERVVVEVTTPSLEAGYVIGVAERMEKPILCLFRKHDSDILSPLISGNERLSVRQYESVIDIERILKNFFRSK